MADPAENAAGKTFAPPPAGMATIYIYRDPSGGSTAINLSNGTQMLGSLAAGTWFRVDVAPGRNDIRCHAENTGSQVLNIAAGETRYVEAELRSGLWALRCGLKEMPAQKAQPFIVNGNGALRIS